jgi:DUF971 family protein
MPIPLDPRKRPSAVKIHVTSGAGVDITWADGHSSHYDFPYLRDECPCATCNDERQKKPKATARAATSVGNYAIQITFNDGHATGIYSYDQLRTICPCPDCRQAFRG